MTTVAQDSASPTLSEGCLREEIGGYHEILTVASGRGRLDGPAETGIKTLETHEKSQMGGHDVAANSISDPCFGC